MPAQLHDFLQALQFKVPELPSWCNNSHIIRLWKTHLTASLTACKPKRKRRRGSFAQEISFPSPKHANVSSAAAKSTFSLLYLFHDAKHVYESPC